MLRKLIIILTGIFILSSCKQKLPFSESEISLLENLDFDLEIISEIKKLTKKEIKQLPAIDFETSDLLQNEYFKGIYAEVKGVEIDGGYRYWKSTQQVEELKSKFKKKGYLIFIYEGENEKLNIAIIKGTNDLAILKYRRTNGVNFGLENKDIVQKISEWKNKYGLDVIGCGRDWVQIYFHNLPSNLKIFAQEVYEFCPDSVEQGVETIENLQKAIKEMQGIWLWWD